MARLIVEGADLVLVIRVVDAHHRHRVLDSAESFDRLPAHALRRRIRRDQLRMRRLQVDQLPHQAVKFLIADRRLGLLGGMGGGDAKLMAGFGAVLGVKRLLEAALWIAACGGVMIAVNWST